MVIHLAAQAGVRILSIIRVLFGKQHQWNFRVIGGCYVHILRRHMLLRLLPSAYGANDDMPYRETIRQIIKCLFMLLQKNQLKIWHTVTLTYLTSNYNVSVFTVYGPWGRPDMAHFKFTSAILKGDKIDVYNYGKMNRDFTYVDDLVNAISLLINLCQTERKLSMMLQVILMVAQKVAPFRVVNIGNSKLIKLMDLIDAIEKSTGLKAIKNFMPIQAGDACGLGRYFIFGKLTGYRPKVDLSQGVDKFVQWYRSYYSI